MNIIKQLVMRNRFTLLLAVLLSYMLLLAIEGFLSGREPDLLRFDNSLFSLDLRELQELELEMFED
jgi:hypothetical protein